MAAQEYCYPYPHPAVTTDVVLFRLDGKKLNLLLIRRGAPPFEGMWALPGGFLDIDEDLEACARRELYEETGLSGVYLEQLHTFGTPGRDPRERVISVVFLGLSPADLPPPRAASDAQKAEWMDVDQLPPLAFDHDRIIALARERLCTRLENSAIGAVLLQAPFTLKKLRKVYERILRHRLEPGRFRARMLGSGLLSRATPGRPRHQQRPLRYQLISSGDAPASPPEGTSE